MLTGRENGRRLQTGLGFGSKAVLHGKLFHISCFFAERILGPLHLVWSRPSYPIDKALCETHMLARLETKGS